MEMPKRKNTQKIMFRLILWHPLSAAANVKAVQVYDSAL
jgi:hypothetical protein